MKKAFVFSIVSAFSILLVTTAISESGVLPAIDGLLFFNNNTRTEVCDNLDEYSWENGSWSSWPDEDIKIVILERHSPEKEFTEKEALSPYADDDDAFPSDFNGIDIGKSHLFFRGDLMQIIPSYLRAKSLKDATHIIMAEDVYIFSTILIHTNFTQDSSSANREFKTTFELLTYLNAHQPRVTSKKYYPVFSSYSFVSIYETKTKRSIIPDIKKTPVKRFAKNPEAYDKWVEMCDLNNLWSALLDKSAIDEREVLTLIDSLDFVPRKEKPLWLACLANKRYDLLGEYIEDFYWKMANDLKLLDPDSINQKNYDLIINNRDLITFMQFVEYCNYGGFDQSIDSIKESKEYLATPDLEWLENSLQKVVNEYFTE